MVGLCGVLGEYEHDTGWMADDLRWMDDEEVTEYTDERVNVHTVYHPRVEYQRQEPASNTGDTSILIWGEVYGFDNGDGYRSRQAADASTTADFCADLYAEYGIDFVQSLNGTFAGIIHDREQQMAFVFTDRLGSHSVYYSYTDRDCFIFSTHLQSLPRHPNIDTKFDIQFLCEYFTLSRIGGTKTPFTGIKELPPSSIISFDLQTGASETEQYWRPSYEPIDAPFSHFATQFAERLQTVLNERIKDDLDYGLLLSGGSDSRAILAGADTDLIAYHATSWLSREARAAERAALMAGHDFRLLRRDRDYEKRMLKRTPQIMNFQGWFSEGQVTGFAEKLRADVDVIISGLYSDSLFRELSVPTRKLSLGPIGTVPLPVAKPTRTVAEYISRQAREVPEYLETRLELHHVLREHIQQCPDSNTIVHHGIEYPSVLDLVSSDLYYPLSNDPDLFYRALTQTMPHWTPFLDNRLIDLALRFPVKHRVRRNVVDAATVAFDPSLSTTRHGTTGVPIGRTFPVSYLWHQWNRFMRKYTPSDDPPKSHTHSPWTNHTELIRNHEFVIETIYESEEIIHELPFLSWKGVHECYRDHLTGADRTSELYTLLSFLEMPVVKWMVSAETPPTA